MFKVTYEVNDQELGIILPSVLIYYDGGRFCLLQVDDDLWMVTVQRRGEWHYFGDNLYESFDDATKAIFYDVMLDRYESGTLVRDDKGNIVGAEPLGYYDRAA